MLDVSTKKKKLIPFYLHIMFTTGQNKIMIIKIHENYATILLRLV